MCPEWLGISSDLQGRSTVNMLRIQCTHCLLHKSYSVHNMPTHIHVHVHVDVCPPRTQGTL